MEITNCRLCQAMLPPPRKIPFPEKELTFYSCKTCGLMQSPASKLDYSSGDLISYYEDRRAWINQRHKYIFQTIEGLLNTKGQKSFLDIGCGIGFSLAEAETRGWKPYGIEPNKDLAAYAQKNLKMNVVNDYFPSSQLPDLQFDFILIDNVIEHLEHPRVMIENAIRFLKPTGILLVAVPPVDWLRLALTKIPYVRKKVSSATVNIFNDTYEHINFVPVRSIRYLAQDLKLELIDVNFHHHKKVEKIHKVLGLNSGYFFLRKDYR